MQNEPIFDLQLFAEGEAVPAAGGEPSNAGDSGAQDAAYPPREAVANQRGSKWPRALPATPFAERPERCCVKLVILRDKARLITAADGSGLGVRVPGRNAAPVAKRSRQGRRKGTELCCQLKQA